MKRIIIEIYKFLFLRPSARILNQLLFQCAAHGLGVLNYRNERDSGEAYLIEQFLQRYFSGRRELTFFDVGANVGDYTRALVAQFPEAVVFSFEPHPSTFEKLLAKHKQSSNVNCVNLGMSDVAGSADIYEREGNRTSQHNSLYKEALDGGGARNSKSTSINLMTLDEFMLSNKIESIDFLKIDTEGHELAVIKGAADAISSGKIGLIQFEFNTMNLYSKASMYDFRMLLKDYSFYRLSPRGLIFLPDVTLYQEIYNFNNILCVPK